MDLGWLALSLGCPGCWSGCPISWTNPIGAQYKLLTDLHSYSLSEFMVLDAATRSNLELSQTIRTGSVRGSLLGVIDQTVTPMGKRLIQQWISKPLLDVQKISERQDGVEIFYQDGLLRAELRVPSNPSMIWSELSTG